MKSSIYAGALLAAIATPALANPPIAIAASQAVAGAAAGGGDGTGTGIGGGASANGGSSSSKDNSTAVGAALGQAPTAAHGCLKGNKFAFGLLEWTDDSSKCENYRIAFEAARQGNWDLANQWVSRADGM